MSVPAATVAADRQTGQRGSNMKKLTKDAFAAAERYMDLHARLIDRLRFAHRFRGGPTGPVLSVLRGYQNPDGGFGNAIEPDLRGSVGQPQGVEMAFWVLEISTIIFIVYSFEYFLGGQMFVGVEEGPQLVLGGREPGEYYFHCDVHPVMNATLVVSEDAEEA
jgi:hypothetical protein